MAACGAAALKRDALYPGVVRGIVSPDIIRKQAIELREGMDGFDIKCVQPPFLERAEMPFHFSFVM